MLGFIRRNLGKQISAVKTDLETAANQAHNRIEGNIKATEHRLSTQIHRDLRGLGERLARVEANA